MILERFVKEELSVVASVKHEIASLKAPWSKTPCLKLEGVFTLQSTEP